MAREPWIVTPTGKPLPEQVIDEAPHCWRCKRIFARKLTRPWQVKCSRCKAVNASPQNGDVPEDDDNAMLFTGG